jgi:hypothetical protein
MSVAVETVAIASTTPSVTPKSKSRKSNKNTPMNDFKTRLINFRNELQSASVSPSVIETYQNLSVELVEFMDTANTAVKDLKDLKAKSARVKNPDRTMSGFQLFNKEVSESVRNEFISTCKTVSVKEVNKATKLEHEVTKYEYSDKNGVVKQSIGVPMPVIMPFISARWFALSQDERNAYNDRAKALKPVAVASTSSATEVVAEVAATTVTEAVASTVVASEAEAVPAAAVPVVEKKKGGRKPKPVAPTELTN